MLPRKTTEEFIQQAKKVHGNKYDYSEVYYINSSTKVKIKCNECGYVFYQLPPKHLRGQGCPKCADIKTGIRCRKSLTVFLKEAKEIHGDKYDYSQVNYINSVTPVKIKCNICGHIFYQTPGNHLQGQGCLKCVREKRSEVLRLSTEEFIQRAKKIHGEKYDYSNIKYKNMKFKIKIFCKKCNRYFWQLPGAHLAGHGCRRCKSSKSEIYIEEYLSKHNISFYRQKYLKGCCNLGPLLFDFYLPDYNLCIEFQGIQHYKPIKFWGGEKTFKENQLRDQIKRDYCKEHNIKLIEIKYNENIEKRLESELFGKIFQ